MRSILVATVAAALLGCAGSRPITPEQRAAIMQYTLQQQQLQQQQANDLANTYTAPMRALPPTPQPFTCTSRTVLGTTTTDCK